MYNCLYGIIVPSITKCLKLKGTEGSTTPVLLDISTVQCTYMYTVYHCTVYCPYTLPLRVEKQIFINEMKEICSSVTMVHTEVKQDISLWCVLDLQISWMIQHKHHFQNSKDHMPRESGSMERAGLKEYMKFRWLHALLM